MNKYTKMALALLYLLQLVVVFREQLAHLYRSAIESVHHQADQAAPSHGGLRAVLERVVKIASPESRLTFVATVSAPVAILHAKHEEHGGHHHSHDEDKEKDRAKKHRRSHVREFLIGNLWHRIRRAAISPSALAERSNDIIRVIVYSSSSAPAA